MATQWLLLGEYLTWSRIEKPFQAFQSCLLIQRHDITLKNYELAAMAKNLDVLKITFYLIIIFLPKGEEKNIVHNVTH